MSKKSSLSVKNQQQRDAAQSNGSPHLGIGSTNQQLTNNSTAASEVATLSGPRKRQKVGQATKLDPVTMTPDNQQLVEKKEFRLNEEENLPATMTGQLANNDTTNHVRASDQTHHQASAIQLHQNRIISGQSGQPESAQQQQQQTTALAEGQPKKAAANSKQQKMANVGSRTTTTTTDNVCAACLKPIRERYLLMALDKQWHEDCLKCACCDCRLGEVGSSLFTHSDKILCRRDFLRIFGRHGSCAACKHSIPPYEFVMRAHDNVYHLHCFSCQQCKSKFCVGDRFYLTQEEKVICIECLADSRQSATTQQQQQQQLHQSSDHSTTTTAAEAATTTTTTILDTSDQVKSHPPPVQSSAGALRV